MMDHYYFYNYEDTKGRHEVHKNTCSFLPAPENRTYIGFYDSCQAAIKAAKARYPYKSFDGCYYCCNSCHQG